MWYQQSVDPSSIALNMSASYRLSGELDSARMKQALTAVVARHEVLRTTYRFDDAGELRQLVHRHATPAWSWHDLRDLTEQARHLRLEVLAQRQFGTPFNLTTDAPLRVTLIRTGSEEHMLLLVAHRIAWDDASWHVFLTDLTLAYDDPEGYADQQTVVSNPDRQPPDRDADDARYWQTLLADPPEPLELPGPNGSVVPRSRRAELCARKLPDDTMNRASRLAADAGSTPFAVMAAAVSALIARYTQTDDFLLASPVLDRGASIGHFNPPVLLRAIAAPTDTFRELLARTHASVTAARAHHGPTLDRVIGDTNPRISIGLRESGAGGFRPAGISCERATLRGRMAQTPLGFTIDQSADGALLEAEYLVEVLDRRLVEQMLSHLEQLLKSALLAPDTPIWTLGLLGEDAEWLQRVSRGRDVAVPPTTLAEIVERQAEATPNATAVTYEGRHYTYRDLNARANQLAHRLIRHGLGAEDPVAVLLDRSPDLVVAALGIVKAGAVYLPIDPAYPADKIAYILTDSAPKLVLRDPVDELDRYPTTNPVDTDRVRPLRHDNVAYIIYTSGSTGAPKGVPVTHASVAEYLAWFGGEYDTGPGDSVLQLASTSFDSSIEEIFGTLGSGARLVVPRHDGLRDVAYLTRLLQREEITGMHLVPSLLGLFLSLPGVSQWRSLRRIPIGGEPLPGELADKFHATFDAPLRNFYGPTETTIATTRYRATGKQGNRVVPIGSPKINTAVHLLDRMLQPLPIGAIGEIYIGGTCLARGYLGRPGLTAERFVADPFRPGGRLYRTGDLARRNAAGDLEFVGRADEHAKVGGYRVELGEVAAAASVDPSVGQCVVVVRDLPATGRSLVAYMTPSSGHATVEIDRVRARVSAALPEYMTPAAYVVLDEIPITTHGKIDRDKLPGPPR